MKKKFWLFAAFILGASVFVLPAAAQLNDLQSLGMEIYFDKSLSSPPNMACADCHADIVGFTGPVPGINKAAAVYPGAVHQRSGNRKPPTVAYAGNSPGFDYDAEEGLFIGGMFWDGRATGQVTGDPLADQAMGPFLNPVEMNLSSEEEVCMKIAAAKYADLYATVFGQAMDCTLYADDGHLVAYKNFARAIAAFERSEAVSPYTSKFDYVQAGMATFSAEEQLGFELFNGKGQCNLCHPAPEFTDFSYDNLGVFKNPDNPFYRMDEVFLDNGEPINPAGAMWVDPGLGGFLASLDDDYFAERGLEKATAISVNEGKHKVPTLRNVDKRPGKGFAKAFMHNGALRSLKEVVHFYNTRDVANWPPPEVEANVNSEELGDLGLTPQEEDAIVTFMLSLSDGYKLPKPKK